MATILDDLRKIHERDSMHMLDMTRIQTDQISQQLPISGTTNLDGVQSIVYSAMGGSALPAYVVQTWPATIVPFEVAQTYEVPAYVGSDTLFIAASFSGNTEETITALGYAEQRNARIVVITSGGRLRHIAETKGYLLILLPPVFSRLSLWSAYKGLLQVLVRAKLTASEVTGTLNSMHAVLDTSSANWLPDVPSRENLAKQLALELMGKTVIVYSGPLMSVAAKKWKIALNENAKQLAWTNQYPELNHNEFTGWTRQPVAKPFAVIELRSVLEYPRVQLRYKTTEQFLSGMRPAPIVVNVLGATILEQLGWSMLLADYVSIYTAIISGIDPGPLDQVAKFKRALDG